MPRLVNLISLVLVCCCCCCSSHLVQAEESSKRSKSTFDAHVGRFNIIISDDWLDKSGVTANKTLLDTTIDQLYDDVWDYWNSYDDIPPSNDTEYATLQNMSTKRFGDFVSNDTLAIIFTNATLAMKLDYDQAANKTIDGNSDLTAYFLDALYTYWENVDYWRWGFILGVGKSVNCSKRVDDILTIKSEWEKLGSGAATTLMALVPTILAFGNLYVPRSSEIFATSALVGLSTSIFSLGLPVTSLPTVKNRRSIDVFAFALSTVGIITAMTRLRSTPAQERDDIDELQSWTQSDDGAEKTAFHNIKLQVEEWRKRWHWWQVPALLLASAQTVMFGLAVAPLLGNPGVSRFMFDCTDPPLFTGLYLAVSATVNAVVRFLMWEIGDHERVKIYSLSKGAKDALQDIVVTGRGKNLPSVASEAPPMYRAILASFKEWASAVGNTLLYALSCFKHDRRRRDDSQHFGPKPDSLGHALQDVRHEVWRNTTYFFRNTGAMVASGFGYHRAKPTQGRSRHGSIDYLFSLDHNLAARRYRPLIVLLHLSTSGRSVFRTLFTGFVEATLLLVLTFFFGAQWGGNLVITLIAMFLLLLFVTAGRVLGFAYLHISMHVWDLHVVNCDDGDQVQGSLRILCAMKDVLVRVNGASYFDGYRVDRWPGFDDFKTRYDRGELDYDDDNVGQGRGHQARKGSSTPFYGEQREASRAASKSSSGFEDIPLPNRTSGDATAGGSAVDVDASSVRSYAIRRPPYQSVASSEPLIRGTHLQPSQTASIMSADPNRSTGQVSLDQVLREP